MLLITMYALVGLTAGPARAAGASFDTLSFNSLTSVAIPDGPVSVVAVDVNGDGKADLVVSGGYYGSNTAGFYVALSKGDGTFAEPVFLETKDAGGGALAAGHFRKGKEVDLFGAKNNAAGTVALGKGAGKFAAPKHLGFPAPTAGVNNTVPHDAKVADLNHDGIDDVVVNVEDALEILFGSADGKFSRGLSLYNRFSTCYALGDLDGDGYPEIVTARSAWTETPDAVEVMANKEGNFDAKKRKTYDLGTREEKLQAVVVADVNGDAKNDVVVAINGNSGSYLKVLLNKGNGELDEPVKIKMSGGPFMPALFAVDVNGDHHVDLVGYLGGDNQAGKVVIIPGKGDGSFSSDTIQVPMGFPSGMPAHAAIAVGDFTGSGVPGVAAIARGGNKAQVDVVIPAKEK